MLKIKDERKDAAILLITHNLAVVAETCHRVIVMYGGKIQEIAPVHELFKKPLHPYYAGPSGIAPDGRWRKAQTLADYSWKCSQYFGPAGRLQVL
jgi:peptide/nickel transport system ATP-binding protein